MPLTRLSTRFRSSGTEVTKSHLNPTAEHKEENQRRKRIRQDTKTKVETPNGVDPNRACPKFERLPDIEDFSYIKKSLSSKEQSTSIRLGMAINSTTVSKVKAPENWEKLLEGIKKIRCSEDAPVDTKGCEKAGNLLPPKVKYLLKGHPDLIEEYQKYLPPRSVILAQSQPTVMPAPSSGSEVAFGTSQVKKNDAWDYLQRVKERFQDQQGTYMEFLFIMRNYECQRAPPTVKEMASTNGGATTMNQSLLGRSNRSPSPSAKKWIREASKYRSSASKDSD